MPDARNVPTQMLADLASLGGRFRSVGFMTQNLVNVKVGRSKKCDDWDKGRM